MRIFCKELHSFTERCMKRAGAGDKQARIVADVLVEADLRGVHSHGVNRLEMYVDELLSGVVDGKGFPSVINETEAIACVDGNNCLGMVVGTYCMEVAMTKARKQGVGWVVAKRSNHYGIAGYYSLMATKQKLIGLSFTNTSPLVFPTRAARGALGTNPIGAGAPTTNPEQPFLLDMATSTVPIGKVEVCDRKEIPVPVGWGCDKNGKSTTNPKEILDGGGLMPLGGPEECAGYKGYGLAMLVEIFTGILAGANYGLKVPPWRKGSRTNANIGQCYVAIDPSFFGDGFEERMSDLVHQMKTLPLAEGETEILVAGEPEKHKQKEYEELGIELHPNVFNALNELSKKLNVDPPVLI